MAQQVSPPDGFPAPSASLDTDALACWELAGWIGRDTADDHLRSFTGLLLAVLHGEAPLSRWFLRYARAAGVKLAEIYATRRFDPAMLGKIRERMAAGETLGGLPPYTVSATNMATGAVGLVARTGGGGGLGLRHLLGAYIYAVPGDHKGKMAEWGFDGPRDGSAFARQMRERHPGEAANWNEVHAQAFSTPPDLAGRDPVSPPRVSGFAADTPDGEDHLDIEDDVYALSTLVCSTKVSPPLSVGLFGDWGSGKSFFMRRLQRGVAWISGHARGSDLMQKDLPFYKNVVQIEFNAWNYSGGNLWAALVQHILENLRLSDGEDPGLVEKRLDHLRKQMQLEQAVKDTAAAREKEARKAVDDLGAELDTLRGRHESEVTELKKVLAEDVLKAVKLGPGETGPLNDVRRDLGLPAAAADAAEFLAAAEATRQLLGRASSLVRYVPKGQRVRFALASTVVLIGPPALALAVAALAGLLAPHLATAAAVASWVSATLAAGAGWLRERTRALDRTLADVERVQAGARRRVEAEERRHQAEAAGLEQRIALARDEIRAAQAKQQEAAIQLGRAAAQLAATTPASVLADFVRERSQSEDYRRHLGLPAVIRRDFESISRLVADENAALGRMTTPEEEAEFADRRVNRIVLYIDDLDRCPEPLVVEVLQAVHLLLAFPLFVAVVAVDARWVSRSLAQHFPGLLTGPPAGPSIEPHPPGPDHATPNDYLEKIFQIPFWLRQPGDEAVRRMVRGLVGPTTGAAPAPVVPAPDPSNGPAPGEVFRHRQHDPRAASLDIRIEELKHMELLAPLLGRSPRTLKRFVNVYRLLKASLPPEEADGFLDPDGHGGSPYQNVLLLLALVNGLPALSDALLPAFAPAPPPGGAKGPPGPTTLEAALSGPSAADEEAREQTGRLTAWLEKNMPGWKETPLARFAAWVPRVSRYSYHLPRG